MCVIMTRCFETYLTSTRLLTLVLSLEEARHRRGNVQFHHSALLWTEFSFSFWKHREGNWVNYATERLEGIPTNAGHILCSPERHVICWARWIGDIWCGIWSPCDWKATDETGRHRWTCTMSDSTFSLAEGVDHNLNRSNIHTNDVWSISGSGPWLLAVIMSLIILVTACGNILLIALVFAHRSLRCTSNCFLVSLFLSDLMVALVVMPPAMLNVLCGTWVLSPGFCPVWLCFDVMCCSASILNLCVISLDRYLLIISPLRYKQRMTPPRALLLVGGAWGLAALTSFLPIEMDWHSLGRMQDHSGHGMINTSVPWLSSYYPASYFQLSNSGTLSLQCRLRVTLPFALVATFLTFFLPSTAICFTYCRILLAARRQARQVEALTYPPYPQHSPGEPSRPPSLGHAAQEVDDNSHQDPPAMRQAPVRT